MIKSIFFLSIITLLFYLNCSNKILDKAQINNAQTNKDSLSAQLTQVLDQEFSLWYPLCIDSVYGGFYSDINYEWKLDGPQNKMIVTQARHIWSTANASMFYKDRNDLLKIAEHGFKFLRDKMWDKQSGGFYDLVSREGKPFEEDGRIIKRAYGNSFAIYGLAEYYKASGNDDALKLAQQTFRWMEKNCYDPEYGGYFQFVTGEGEPFKNGYKGTPPKDQNSCIHILEAFTELYSVWPDSLLKERLSSMLHIIRDIITTKKGYLVLFFDQKWTPAGIGQYEFDHVSFGHDVETAYLMLEASEALGIKNDSITLRTAKTMIDHALNNGWDTEHGGIFDGGYYYKNKEKAEIIKDTKEWWAQAEALNSFLLMSQLFPGDKLNYYDKFCIQWDYIKTYLLDDEYGGWYWGGLDKAEDQKYGPKSTIWKCNYHTSRSLINCIKMLSKPE
ncbi:MAG TPA: AGE family epimerase/isomerase [Ignavibacteriaceae bacterium]|nr:AGE family epimerase/isomerase [Ignavibacteriaceae bacterium]